MAGTPVPAYLFSLALAGVPWGLISLRRGEFRSGGRIITPAFLACPPFTNGFDALPSPLV